MDAPRRDLTVRSHRYYVLQGRLLSNRNADNPYSRTHGAPDDEERHVGDLGNVSTDDKGTAQGVITDKLIKLIGPDSVVGVSFS